MADAQDSKFYGRDPELDPPRQELPPKWRGPAIAIFAVVAVAVSALLVLRKTETAALWVVNPGPGPVTVDIDGETHTIEKGKVLDIAVPLEPTLALAVKRGDATKNIDVKLDNHLKAVTIVDLGGDAAYAVVDTSSFYAASGPTEKLPMKHVSPAAEVHALPFPAAKLVRPGRSLPEKGSWELNVFKRPDAQIEMFKVFRIDPKRLDEPAKLAVMFKEAIMSPNASDYENMQIVTRTSTAPRKSIFDGAADN